MKSIADTVKTPAPSNVTLVPKEPKGVRITLTVCGCYRAERITFVTAKAARVASILGITIQDLECAAVVAQFTGKPEVLAHYRQHDLAEQKLSQLKQETPFIAKSHHSFSLVPET